MKKIISLLLCLVLMLGVTACGGKDDGNKPDANSSVQDSGSNGETEKSSLLSREEAEAQGLLKGKLIIRSMNKGYGVTGLEKVAREYEKRHKGVTIDVKGDGGIETTFSNTIGVKRNDIDIYFNSEIDFPKFYLGRGTNNLLDFTDFLKFWDNDDGEKMENVISKDIVNMLSIVDKQDRTQNIVKSKNKHVFTLPWAGGGTCGFVYNYKIFEEVGIKVPTTTDEMFDAFDKILAYNEKHPDKKPIVPIIYPGADAMEYWTYLTYVWWAQYEGYDRFMKYWTLTEDGNVYNPSKDLYKQEGQKKAMEITYRILTNPAYVGAKGLGTEVVQKNFALGTSNYRFAMTPNGDWFYNETQSNASNMTDDFRMMPTPKLSAAVEKYAGVDNVPTLAFTLAPKHNIAVPSYSKEKYLALDFLSFYFSQTGAKLFAEGSRALLPLSDYSFIKTGDPTYEKMNEFQRSELAIAQNESIRYIAEAEQLSPVRYIGNMPVYPDGKTVPEKSFLEGKTVTEIYNGYITGHDSHWSEYTDFLA